jgi:hypothetical protein
MLKARPNHCPQLSSSAPSRITLRSRPKVSGAACSFPSAEQIGLAARSKISPRGSPLATRTHRVDMRPSTKVVLRCCVAIVAFSCRRLWFSAVPVSLAPAWCVVHEVPFFFSSYRTQFPCNTTGKRFAASRCGSSAKCAYRAVVCCWVCPKSFPTIGKETPLETRCDANECRKSWMRTPESLAILHTFAHGPFRSVRWGPVLPGNKYSPSRGTLSSIDNACSLSGTYSVRFCFCHQVSTSVPIIILRSEQNVQQLQSNSIGGKPDIKTLLGGQRSDLCTGPPNNHCGQYSAAASCSEELFSLVRGGQPPRLFRLSCRTRRSKHR